MNRALPLHGEIPAPKQPVRFALARKGFRPFFLLAALYACAIVPVWLLVLFGVLHPTAYLDATTWHAHEMIFGFTVAVIAGFLLTAVGNWTGRETAVGPKLLALAGVWTLGRIAMAAPTAFPRGVAAVLDLAFLPLLAAVLLRPLVASTNRRNFVMIAVLAALAGANLAVHLEALGVLAGGSGRHAERVAIDVVVFLCLVIAGRILPMFTRNAIGAPGAERVASSRPLEVAAIVSMVAVTGLDVAVPDARATAAFSGIAGALALARAARWGTRHTVRHPLLWILHAGYAWIGVGLLLRALPVPASCAAHALTVGAIGGLTLGMMARVSLGHTGRSLAPPKTMPAAFFLVSLSALVRVAGPLVWPSQSAAALVLAGLLWTAAFALYLFSYAPILASARVDGKPG
jgi:uncharacterized protein involved in response to NO